MRRYIVVFLFCLMASPAFADTIELKSGKTVEGKIVDRGDGFVKVDQGVGIDITYFLDEVVTINGEEIVSQKGGQAGQAAPVPDEKDKAVLADAPPLPEKPTAAPDNAQPAAEEGPQVAPAQESASPEQVSSPHAPASVLRQDASSGEPAKEPAPGPAGKAQGEIEGRPFSVERAELKNNVLELRQGKDFFPELGFSLFLFSPEGPSWENAVLHITPETTGRAPHIYKKWKVEGRDIPESKSYTTDYYLDLSLGEIRDGKIQGTIDLRLKDESGSHVKGTFEALVESTSQGPTVTITKNGTKVARPMTAAEKALAGGAAAGVMGLVLLFGVAMYVVTCIPFYLISKKTGIGTSFFAWVPILNVYLMLQLAEKPGWWLILMFVPVVNIVIIILTYCGVAETCRLPAWVGALALVPFVNILLPWYFLYSVNQTPKEGVKTEGVPQF